MKEEAVLPRPFPSMLYTGGLGEGANTSRLRSAPSSFFVTTSTFPAPLLADPNFLPMKTILYTSPFNREINGVPGGTFHKLGLLHHSEYY